MVLGFESEYSGAEAPNWIRSFNLKCVVPLTLCDKLSNALYVVQFEAVALNAVKALLLASSPLGAGEIFASINDYTLTFDPCSQHDFRHLVTVKITQGSPVLVGIIQFLTAGIGKFVKGVLGDDHRHMSAVVICLYP